MFFAVICTRPEVTAPGKYVVCKIDALEQLAEANEEQRHYLTSSLQQKPTSGWSAGGFSVAGTGLCA